MNRLTLTSVSVCLVGMTCLAHDAAADLIPLLNPGGEEYAPSTPPNVSIEPGGAITKEGQTSVPPISVTGWNSTLPVTVGEEGIEGIGNNAHGGEVRLAFGAVNADPATDDDTNLASDFILFQETDKVVAAGDEYLLSFFGRSFFQFSQGDDVQTSFFGYVDGSGLPVQVDVKQHPSTIGGVWTETSHTFLVPGGSPLIGQNLAIGFFTDTPDQFSGGFTSVDDVVLSLVPEGPTGDVNGDNLVNQADVVIIANNFRTETVFTSDGDLSGDGMVDFADFRIWKDASGSAVTLDEVFGAPVPEPGSLALAALATAGLVGAARRQRGTS